MLYLEREHAWTFNLVTGYAHILGQIIIRAIKKKISEGSGVKDLWMNHPEIPIKMEKKACLSSLLKV